MGCTDNPGVPWNEFGAHDDLKRNTLADCIFSTSRSGLNPDSVCANVSDMEPRPGKPLTGGLIERVRPDCVKSLEKLTKELPGNRIPHCRLPSNGKLKKTSTGMDSTGGGLHIPGSKVDAGARWMREQLREKPIRTEGGQSITKPSRITVPYLGIGMACAQYTSWVVIPAK